MKFKLYGPMAYSLTGVENAGLLFEKLWPLSTHFAIVSLQEPFDIELVGKKKLRVFKTQFDEFPILESLVIEGYWATAWPGTVRPKGSLLIHGKTTAQAFGHFFPEISPSVFWEGPGGWEDLMLFNESSLMYYCCTHDYVGKVFGTSKWFQDLDFHPLFAANKTSWQIECNPFPLQKVLEKARRNSS